MVDIYCEYSIADWDNFGSPQVLEYLNSHYGAEIDKYIVERYGNGGIANFYYFEMATIFIGAYPPFRRNFA